jgi:large subunit ribosomal protein L7/L12
MEPLKKETVIDALGNMSVMQLIALTKHLEEQWGVKAEPQMVQQTFVPKQENQAVQTEFNVTLMSYPPDKKMGTIKVLKEMTGLGLKEAKELAEKAPVMIKEGVTTEDAQLYKTKLEEAGAVIEVK